MSATTCPSPEELFDYVVGRLSDEASDGVAEHLESCESCQAGLATFDDADDTLVARLRRPAAEDAYLQESQCPVAVARAKAVAGRPVSKGDKSADPASTQSLLLGALGEYQLLAKLGRGGMGTVYKAIHTKLDRVVALKVLSRSRSDDEKAIARFEREMKAIGRLDHPHIVRAHDAREIEGKPVLIMEYVEGLDLGKLVRRLGPLPVANACELARQAALGLQYAHENGLVHRDVKPSNLMLTPEGEVKVLDLGLARFHLEHADGEEVTGTGQAMGTADYMAPEQASDSHAVDIRADIYSLGCTLYKLLTGRAPFAGPEYRGSFEKMTAHVQEPVPPIRELDPEIPEELAAVLDRMLAKEPDERFATPQQVADVLEPFCIECDLAGLVVRAAAAAGEPPSPALPRDSSSAAPHSQPTPLPFWRRWRLLAAAVGLMLLSVGAGIPLGIIITIYKDGKTTTVGVEDGSTVNIDSHGNVGVTPPGERQKPAPSAPKSDFEAIQGTWEVVRGSHNPNNPALVRAAEGDANVQQILKSTKVVITRDTLKVQGSHVVDITFKFQINPNAKPKIIDLKAAGEVGLGVYELQGDRLVVCCSGMAVRSRERPREVWAEYGSEKELLVLKRLGAPVVQADEKAIQGKWEIVRCESQVSEGLLVAGGGGGMVPLSFFGEPSGEIAKGRQIEINRHSLTLKPAPGRPSGMGGMQTWQRAYAIDPTRQPKTIDFSLSAYYAYPGIYEIDADQLRICASLVPFSRGPVVFGAETDSFESRRPKSIPAKPGENQVVIVMRRVRDVSALPDAEVIQGTWKAVGRASRVFRQRGVSKSGKPWGTPLSPEEQAKHEKVVITEDRFTFAAGTADPEEYQYRLGPTNTPKTIEFLLSGKRSMAGIYELQGDQLKILISGIVSEGKWYVLADQRPAGFPSEPGTDHILLVLERDKIAIPERLDVHVDKDGGASVDGKIYDRRSLRNMLQEIVKENPRMRVRLSAASETQHRHVVAILDLVNAAGVTDVAVGVTDVSIVAAEIAPARLDFRIAPTRRAIAGTQGERDVPGLDDAEIKRYLDDLKANGPQSSRQSGGPLAWFELTGDAGPDLITASCRGQQYVLLATTPGDVMLAEEDGKRAWGLEAVHLEKGPQGKPAIGMDFDKDGQKRFAALTESHLDQRLAMLLNDRVVCAPMIRTKLTRRALMMGRFDDKEVQQMLRALQAGMVKPSQTTSPEEPQAAAEPMGSPRGILDLRIAPSRGGDGWAVLDEATIEDYIRKGVYGPRPQLRYYVTVVEQKELS